MGNRSNHVWRTVVTFTCFTSTPYFLNHVGINPRVPPDFKERP